MRICDVSCVIVLWISICFNYSCGKSISKRNVIIGECLYDKAITLFAGFKPEWIIAGFHVENRRKFIKTFCN